MGDYIAEEGNEVEIGEIIPAKEPVAVKNVEKMDKYSISEDPYLTDDQKDVLFRYEFQKRVAQIQCMSLTPALDGTYQGKATLLKLQSGANWLIYAAGPGIKVAWEYYKDNIRGGTPENFIARLKEALGADKVRAICVETLETGL